MADIENVKPSRNPANDGTMVGMLRQFAQKALQSTDDMMPAKVISFDRTSNRAQVQPMIKMLATDGQTMNRAQVASVPVFQIGGGGFILNFNLKAGDLGWIKASDRDISLYLQGQGASEQHPNTNRLHSFEDGLFFPDVLTGFTIDAEDAENCVLQTLDGSQRIAIWADKIKVTSTTEVIIESPLVTIDAPQTTITGKLTVNDDVNMLAKLDVVDNIATSTGDVIATVGDVIATVGDVMAQLITLKTHLHGYTQPNPSPTSTSGEPVPP